MMEDPTWLSLSKKENKTKNSWCKDHIDMTVHQETEYSSVPFWQIWRKKPVVSSVSLLLAMLPWHRSAVDRGLQAQHKPTSWPSTRDSIPWASHVNSQASAVLAPLCQPNNHGYTQAGTWSRWPCKVPLNSSIYDSFLLFHCENVVTSPPIIASLKSSPWVNPAMDFLLDFFALNCGTENLEKKYFSPPMQGSSHLPKCHLDPVTSLCKLFQLLFLVCRVREQYVQGIHILHVGLCNPLLQGYPGIWL